MTCYDCINYDDCIKRGDVAAINLTEDSEKECDLFKNKDNFVEVVRCKDCDRSAKYKDYYLCGVDNRAVNADSFCSYGERRTDDESEEEVSDLH
jgi:hypothetical protein